jgi:hypothetical protein
MRHRVGLGRVGLDRAGLGRVGCSTGFGYRQQLLRRQAGLEQWMDYYWFK